MFYVSKFYITRNCSSSQNSSHNLRLSFISKFLIPLWVVLYLKISYDTKNSLSHNSLYRLGLFFILEFLYHVGGGGGVGVGFSSQNSLYNMWLFFISKFPLPHWGFLQLRVSHTTWCYSSSQNSLYHLRLFLISEFLIPIYVSLYLAIPYTTSLFFISVPYTTWGCASCISEFLIPLGVVLHLKIQYNNFGCPHLTMPYTTSGCTYLRIPYTTKGWSSCQNYSLFYHFFLFFISQFLIPLGVVLHLRVSYTTWVFCSSQNFL